jgi:biopolymer transport protein TolR
MSSRSSLRGHRRRIMSEINVVPYIDVMLVLLVIFMVTAPLVNPGVVNLPTVGGAKVQTLPPVFLTIAADEKITVRKEGESIQTLNRTELGNFARAFAAKQSDKADQPVVLAADKSIKYELVMDVMSVLKENGVKRVGLAVRSQ